MKTLLSPKAEVQIVKRIARTNYREVARTTGLSRGKLFELVQSHRNVYDSVDHNEPRGRQGGPKREFGTSVKAYGRLTGLQIRTKNGKTDLLATFENNGQNRNWHVTDPRLFTQLAKQIKPAKNAAPITVEQKNQNWQIRRSRRPGTTPRFVLPTARATRPGATRSRKNPKSRLVSLLAQ